jgi:methylmalonyl-CoA mutase N-terminal domain/subunit
VQLSLRTQQILAYESGVCDSVDPLGGSYLVERLTNTLEAEARGYIERIDSLGGALAAIEQGFPQREIQESSYRYQRDIESERRVVVGVNKFISPFPKMTGLLRLDPEVAKRQKERLDQVKQNRDNARVSAALQRLEGVAKGTENTMPAFLECVEAYATIGEMCDVLRGVFGEQKELLIF